MIEKGYRGGLVSRIRNQHSGKKYMISTTQELVPFTLTEKDYWSIVVMPSKFFGLWFDWAKRWTFIRNNKEDAYNVHEQLKKIVETIPGKEWLESFPNPSPPASKDKKIERAICFKNSINFERAGLGHFSPYNDCLTSRLNGTT